MTDFTQQLSTAIANARPRYLGGGGGRGSRIMKLENLKESRGGGDLAAGLGQVGGFLTGKAIRKKYEWWFDPKEVERQAATTWEFLSGIENQKGKNAIQLKNELISVLKNPATQAKIQDYMKTQAGRIRFTKREDLNGLYGPVTSTAMEQQKRMGEAEISFREKSATALEKETKYKEEDRPQSRDKMLEELSQLKLEGKAKQFSFDEMKRLASLNEEQLQAELDSTKADVAAKKEATRFDRAAFDKRLTVLEEQAKSYKVGTAAQKQKMQFEYQDRPLEQQMNFMNSQLLSGQIKTQKQALEGYEGVISRELAKQVQLTKDKEITRILGEVSAQRKINSDTFKLDMDLTKYALSNASNIKSKLAHALEPVRYQDAETKEVFLVPGAIDDSAARGNVNLAFEELYGAFAAKQDTISWEDLTNLYSSMFDLYGATYGQVPKNVAPGIPALSAFAASGGLQNIKDQMDHMLLKMIYMNPEHPGIAKLKPERKEQLQKRYMMNPPSSGGVVSFFKNLFTRTPKENLQEKINPYSTYKMEVLP